MEQKLFEINLKQKKLFYLFHILVESLVFIFLIIVFIVLYKKFLNFSWVATIILVVLTIIILYIRNIISLTTSWTLFFRAIKPFKKSLPIMVNEMSIAFGNQTVLWDNVKGLVFKTLFGGSGFIVPKKIEKFLGYFVLNTADKNYSIPCFISNQDDLLKIIVKNAHLKKIAPTIEKSFKYGATIFHRGQGSFYGWERRIDYIPTEEDFVFKVSYTKDFFSLFFVLLFGFALVFVIAYLAVKLNLIK